MTTASQPVAATGRPPLLVPALLSCYLIWGSTYLAIRFALVSFPPLFAMGTRFLAAGGLLMAFVRWRGRRLGWPLPTRAEWRNALLVGTLLLAGWGLLFGQRPSRRGRSARCSRRRACRWPPAPADSRAKCCVGARS